MTLSFQWLTTITSARALKAALGNWNPFFENERLTALLHPCCVTQDSTQSHNDGPRLFAERNLRERPELTGEG